MIRVTFKLTEISELPEHIDERAGRPSRSWAIIRALKSSDSQKLAISSDDEHEIGVLYRTLVQWIGRHPDDRVAIRKDGSTLYVWVREADDRAKNKVIRAAPRTEQERKGASLESRPRPIPAVRRDE